MEQSYLFILTMMIIPAHVRENLSPIGYAIPIRGGVAGPPPMAALGGATLNQTATSGGKSALIFDGAKFPRPTPILPASIRWQKGKARFALNEPGWRHRAIDPSWVSFLSACRVKCIDQKCKALQN